MIPAAPQIAGRSTVCTLYEGDYQYGVAALFNSLYASGFRGTMVVGHRGALPAWARLAEASGGCDMFAPAIGCEMAFVNVKGETHLTQLKPTFMLEIHKNLSSEIPSLTYFDPDLVVRFPWGFFEAWAEQSVALCADVNASLSSNHPKRQAWREFFGERGVALPRSLDTYVNAGFIGVPKASSHVLREWQQMLELMHQGGIDRSQFGCKNDYRFWFPDQDALNVALMRPGVSCSVAGRDAMAFVHGVHYMYHAVGVPKPWNKPFIRAALRGRPPSCADIAYWSNVRTPIAAFSEATILRRQRAIKIAGGIGRCWMRA